MTHYYIRTTRFEHNARTAIEGMPELEGLIYIEPPRGWSPREDEIVFRDLTKVDAFPLTWSQEALERANARVIREEIIDCHDGAYWRKGHLVVKIWDATALRDACEMASVYREYPCLSESLWSEIQYRLFRESTIVSDAIWDALHFDPLREWVDDHATEISITPQQTVAAWIYDRCYRSGELYLSQDDVAELRAMILATLWEPYGDVPDRDAEERLAETMFRA